MILSSRQNVDNCELVVEEVVCHCPPSALEGVSLEHCVVQSVVPLLIGGGRPGQSHCPRDVLLQLDWTWGHGVVCVQIQMTKQTNLL